MQRSRLLRRRAEGSELAAWEEQIVAHGMKIVEQRQLLVRELNGLLQDERPLTEDPVRVDLPDHDLDPDAWRARLRDRRSDDARIGSLRFGPHVDSVKIEFRQREIRIAGSRGQQKLAAVAIKMAECALWRKYRHLIPVILIDDALEALDRQRQIRLLAHLAKSPAQILMTTPEGGSHLAACPIHVQRLSEGGLVEDVLASQTARTTERMMEEAA